MDNTQSRFQIHYWIPAIIAAICISVFSTHYFSSEQTALFFYPRLQWLFPFASPRAIRLMHVAIRKCAHITEFGVFSITVFHGVRQGRRGWQLNWAVITLIIAVAYAGLDEYHQSFVPLREARVQDVFIDATGALLAQVIVWIFADWVRIRAALFPPKPAVSSR